MHLSGASLEDIRKALEPKFLIDPATKVPLHYHRNLQVFDQSQADTLARTLKVRGGDVLMTSCLHFVIATRDGAHYLYHARDRSRILDLPAFGRRELVATWKCKMNILQ
jgi:hypothetical protein